MSLARSIPPRFDLRRQIGTGGNGVVWEALDRDRGALVALKTLQKLGPVALLRLKNEFRAVSGLSHPNLATLHDLFVDGETCLFTMELVPGRDIVSYVRSDSGPTPRSVLGESTVHVDDADSHVRISAARSVTTRREGSADEQKLRHVLAQLVAGVRALHAAGKLHRDLKPPNVLVEDGGRLAILDYGLVIDRDERLIGFEGTAAYAAPEQAALRGVDAASDWYGVGVILFQMLTGGLPFEGSQLQILVDKQQRDAPRVESRIAGAPRDLADLCAALLARDPLARPAGEEISQRLLGHEGARGARVSALASQTLFGREPELLRLGAALDKSRGAPCLVAVEGPSGIGKSALLRGFLAGAAKDGALVLSGRCNHRESIPYNAFDGVVDALAKSLGHRDEPIDIAPDEALFRVFPVLASVFEPVEADVVSPDVQRRRAFASLGDILARLSRDTPLIVVVDDWHWADRDSHLLLDELLRATELRALFVLARRAGDGASTLPWSAERISLAPLSPSAARELASALGTDRADLDSIVRASGGHPLFLQEIARHRAEPRGEEPTDLDRALVTRVAALPELSRRVVELLSLSVTPLHESLLARLTGGNPAELARTIEHLRSDRLVVTGAGREGNGVEPAHARVREAVSLALTEAAQKSLHHALAGVAPDPHALVHHLAGAGDRRGAALRAEETGRVAARALAFDRAAVLFRDAISLGDHDPEQKRVIQSELADALANAHLAVEAAEELLSIASSTRGPVRRAALRRAAELFLTSGDLERGKSILDSVLRELELPMPDSTAGTLLALASERARLAFRGLSFHRRAPQDPRLVERAELLRGIAQGLGMADNLRAALYQARSLRAALDLGDPARAATALALEAIFRGSVDSKSRVAARLLLDDAERISRDSDDTEPACWIEAGRAVLDALALDRPEVVDRLARAEESFQARTTGATWALDSLRLVRALSLRILGGLDAIRDVLPALLRDAERRHDRYLETTLVRGSVILWLCEDDPSGARASVAKTRWAPREQGFHIQHWLEIEAHAEIDLYEGRGERTLRDQSSALRALRFAPILRLQRPRVLARGMHGRLLVAAAAAGVSRTASLLEAEVLAGRLEREAVGYASMRASLLRAGIASVRGREDDVMRHLRAAIALGDRHGLELSVAAARARLSRLIGGEEGRALAAESESWMTRGRVRRPAQLIEMETPGRFV